MFMVLLFLPLALVIGAPIFLVSFVQAFRKRWLLRNGEATEATVTKLEQYGEDNDWRAVYSFRGPDGATQTGKGDLPTPPGVSVGEKVWVVYSPAKPARHTMWPRT